MTESGGMDVSEQDDFGASWRAVEAALPDGAAMVRLTWRIGMHEKFPPDEDYEARAEWWEADDRIVDGAYGPTPAAALRALASRLSSTSPEKP